MAPKHIVILFYRFCHIPDPAALCQEQKELASSLRLTGRMLIAHEGVNATFEGDTDAIVQYKVALAQHPLLANIVIKESEGTGTAFNGLSIKVREEIVTLGAGEFDVQNETAPEITAQELEALYEKGEDFAVLDLRNDYEIEAGRFEKTVDPGLKNFRDLPGKIAELSHLKDKKVVAVCTGGIRCEKATCLLRREGFSNVSQLKDGIHTYMQEFPGRHFKGTLFVFDNRMVTPVVDTPQREITGRCAFCNTPSEDFYSDDSERPSRKVICCDSCIGEHGVLRASRTR